MRVHNVRGVSRSKEMTGTARKTHLLREHVWRTLLQVFGPRFRVSPLAEPRHLDAHFLTHLREVTKKNSKKRQASCGPTRARCSTSMQRLVDDGAIDAPVSNLVLLCHYYASEFGIVDPIPSSQLQSWAAQMDMYPEHAELGRQRPSSAAAARPSLRPLISRPDADELVAPGRPGDGRSPSVESDGGSYSGQSSEAGRSRARRRGSQLGGQTSLVPTTTLPVSSRHLGVTVELPSHPHGLESGAFFPGDMPPLENSSQSDDGSPRAADGAVATARRTGLSRARQAIPSMATRLEGWGSLPNSRAARPASRANKRYRPLSIDTETSVNKRPSLGELMVQRAAAGPIDADAVAIDSQRSRLDSPGSRISTIFDFAKGHGFAGEAEDFRNSVYRLISASDEKGRVAIRSLLTLPRDILEWAALGRKVSQIEAQETVRQVSTALNAAVPGLLSQPQPPPAAAAPPQSSVSAQGSVVPPPPTPPP